MKIYKIANDIDNQYLEAIRSGNIDIAQNMVDEAAKRAGYTIKAYHGTPHGKFNVFDASKKGEGADNVGGVGDYGNGFYFTLDKEEAQSYATGLTERKIGNSPNVMSVYLKINNPFTFEKYYEYEKLFAQKIKDKGLFNITEEESKDMLNSINSTQEEIDFIKDIGGSMGDNWQDTDFETILSEKGYDGVISPNGEHIVYKPNQIKSAEPVVYDDQGNIIPISQRFNTNSSDIRAKNDTETTKCS